MAILAKRIFLFLFVNMLVMVTINIFIGVLALLGFHIPAGYGGLMVWSAIWGMGGAFVSLLMSKQMAKWMLGVQVISPSSADSRAQDLVSMVNRLAHNAGLPRTPEVGIYNSDEVNAFATGPSRGNALVAVSTGLLARLPQDQVEAVLGHEISHVANGDMVTMTLIQGIINAFVLFFSRIIAVFAGEQVDAKFRWITEMAVSIIAQIAFSFLGMIVVSYFSRLREYRADAGSARLLGPEKMIAALQTLGRTRELIEPNQPALATLKIADRPSWTALFSTHPSLEDRIARLRAMHN